MAAILIDTIKHHLASGQCATMYNIDNEFCILENSSYNILPNYPYRSDVVVALFCRNGRAQGRVNTITYDIEPNSFFILLPNQIGELISMSDDFDATYIIMSNRFTESLNVANTFSVRNIVAAQPSKLLDQRMVKALENFLHLCRNLIPVNSNPHRLEILSLITRAFFLGLGYFLHEQYSTDHTQSRDEEITEAFISLVERHYRQHRDMAFYAEKMNLTSKYISTVVKQASGRSAVEWIEKYVLLDATTQLLSTERTIKQIAYDLNFPTQSAFGKYFVRVVGMSPVAYREKERR
ncbi:MAG: AraC family transcriptional regulator [Alistipes sp.]|nr:AraC family transcriptional regulator [Alistipes sp.]